LASVTGSSSLLQEAAEICGPIIRDGKRYRGLNALAQKDHPLLRALSRGEFALSGIRNADLRASLYPPTKLKIANAEIRRAVPRSLANLLCCELMVYSENCLAPIATKSLQKADQSSLPYWPPATLMFNNLPRWQLKNPREIVRS
jgi:hypothetical protein